jgi:hypothetical protein
MPVMKNFAIKTQGLLCCLLGVAQICSPTAADWSEAPQQVEAGLINFEGNYTIPGTIFAGRIWNHRDHEILQVEEVKKSGPEYNPHFQVTREGEFSEDTINVPPVYPHREGNCMIVRVCRLGQSGKMGPNTLRFKQTPGADRTVEICDTQITPSISTVPIYMDEDEAGRLNLCRVWANPNEDPTEKLCNIVVGLTREQSYIISYEVAEQSTKTDNPATSSDVPPSKKPRLS